MDPGLSSVVSLDSTERLRNEVRRNYARCGTTSITHQLFRPHVVQDPLGVLTVVTALHDGQKQLGGVILLNRGEKVSELLRASSRTSFPTSPGRPDPGYDPSGRLLRLRSKRNAWYAICVRACVRTFSSSTRSILFLPRGLMSFKMSAMMMSMPLHS